MTLDKTEHADDSLSRFAEHFYARAEVRGALLTLQDEQALDVLLLLLACWLGRRGVPAGDIDWPMLVRWQQPWQAQVIAPLRAVRIALRRWPQAEQLREAVKRSELEAEWLQLAQLEQKLAALQGRRIKDEETTAAQLRACCQAQGVEPPAPLLAVLLG